MSSKGENDVNKPHYVTTSGQGFTDQIDRMITITYYSLAILCKRDLWEYDSINRLVTINVITVNGIHYVVNKNASCKQIFKKS